MITKAPIKAAAYYRMSTDKQEDSIADQRKAVIRYAADNGYEIIAEYVDEAISGDKTEKRLGFQRMIADCDSGRFDAVLAWDQDRVGRFDSLEAGYWLKPMRDAGVQLVTVSQGPIDWNDFGGRVLWSIQQEAKNSFLRDLSRNVMRGSLEVAKTGKWTGGKPPFGYAIDPETRRLVPGDVRDIETVRDIFRLYNRGKSLRSVACILNERGTLSSSGRNWSGVAVRAVLCNRAYRGDFVWNRRSRAKYNRIQNGVIGPSRSRTIVKNDQDDQIVIEGTHEPIVDRKTFDRVQRLLAKRRHRTDPTKKMRFALTGLLRCGHCGHSMRGKADFTKGKRRLTYTCSGYHYHGTAVCNCNSIRQDALLECLLTKIRDAVIPPEDFPKLEAEMRRQLKERQRPTDAGLVAKQIAQLDGKIAKAQQRIVEVDSDMLPVVQDHLRELRRERQNLAARQNALNGPQNATEDEHDKIITEAFETLSRLPETLEDADMAQLADVLAEIVDGIDLYFSHRKAKKYTKHEFERGLVRLRFDPRIVKPVNNKLLCLTSGETGIVIARTDLEAVVRGLDGRFAGVKSAG